MSNELDSLSDTQLSEVFAVEVAGWTELVKCTCGVHMRGVPPQVGSKHVPDFATSADAVLPFLDGYSWVAHTYDDGILVATSHDRREALAPFGVAPTFARAACIAIILANRAEKH